ncbi:UDP-N-acetyl-D-mannosamine dehydrogenase [Thiotrichales bacterium 19S9-12]|nr:UDP-N-acetyl-D-mannosamine dehydrogenase [Thiotrichales bacterium 19S9-11]MCF6810966.1 UDP-N-acetyl-D-mannosamine dehydrogenase [Thiotrichales bacterium 19S9-12]
MMQKINVYGLGYIGLPTASLLATKGYDVLGIDISKKVVDMINSGEVHIVEPDLDILVKSAVNSNKLQASLKPKPADIHIIAVPTPFKENYQPDLSYVESAVKNLCDVLKNEDLVILESTSPVGTTEFIYDTIRDLKPNLKEVYVSHSPERVIPGRVLLELVENDRVIGGINQISTEKTIEFYQGFVKGKVLATNARTAEMTKLTENSFRDVNIAFANELSLICHKLGIDVWELIRLANHHPRVNILQPGPGVGGHCIAVDPWFIVSAAPNEAKLIKKSREINDYKPQWVIDQVIKQADKFKHPVVACLGATFKADIDDLRESPALSIIKELKHKLSSRVLVVEPNVDSLEDIELTDLEHALKQADIILILVDHKEFKALDKPMLLDKCVIDTKGIFAL